LVRATPDAAMYLGKEQMGRDRVRCCTLSPAAMLINPDARIAGAGVPRPISLVDGLAAARHCTAARDGGTGFNADRLIPPDDRGRVLREMGLRRTGRSFRQCCPHVTRYPWLDQSQTVLHKRSPLNDSRWEEVRPPSHDRCES
jgi:hypothetical protein